MSVSCIRRLVPGAYTDVQRARAYEFAAVGLRVIWLMLINGPGNWRFVKAEPPCWKGEVCFSLHFCHAVIGWQAKPKP